MLRRILSALLTTQFSFEALVRKHISHVGVYDSCAWCLVALPWRRSYHIVVNNVTHFLGRLLATEVHFDLFTRLFSPVHVLEALSGGQR